MADCSFVGILLLHIENEQGKPLKLKVILIRKHLNLLKLGPVEVYSLVNGIISIDRVHLVVSMLVYLVSFSYIFFDKKLKLNFINKC